MEQADQSHRDLRAEVERLREEVVILRKDSAEHLADSIRYREELWRLRAAVQAVRNMHRESFPDPEGRTGCTACAVAWPCATIRHLDAALGGEQDE